MWGTKQALTQVTCLDNLLFVMKAKQLHTAFFTLVKLSKKPNNSDSPLLPSQIEDLNYFNLHKFMRSHSGGSLSCGCFIGKPSMILWDIVIFPNLIMFSFRYLVETPPQLLDEPRSLSFRE